MATAAEHRDQAAHNEAFLASLDLPTTPYLDWATTIIFYAAVHYLRALMAHHRVTNVTSYALMDAAFERVSGLKGQTAIHTAYRQLKDDSRSARYDMWRPRLAEVVELRDEDLRTIREFVLARLP